MRLASIVLALVATPALAGPWVCKEQTDRMDGHVTRYWFVDSSNQEAIMPWSRPAPGRLVVGSGPLPVSAIIPDDGIVGCTSRAPCPARISIDGNLLDATFLPVTDFTVAADIDPAVLAAAHQVKVEVPVFQSRPAVFTFDLPGQAPASCPLL